MMLWFRMLILSFCWTAKWALPWTCGGFHSSDYTDYTTPDDAQLENPCTFTVNQSSIEEFQARVQKKNMRFSYVHLVIQGIDHVNYTASALYPCIWVWAANVGIVGRNPWTSFPYDFDILSLGLLQQGVSYSNNIGLTVSQENCSVVIGNNKTDVLLAGSLNALMTNFQTFEKTSYFCHTVKFDVYKENKFWYYFTHFLGIRRDYEGFRCWLGSDPFASHVNIRQTRWLILVNLLGALFYLYLPLLMCCMPDVYLDETHTGYDNEKHETLINSATPASALVSIISKKEGKWFYLGETPIGLENVIIKALGLRSKCLWSSRLRRAVLPLLTAGVMFIQISVYFGRKQMSTRQRLDHDIPVGDLCIIFGFNACLKNSIYFLGGAYVTYGIFICAGGLLLCLPQNLAEVLTRPISCKRQKNGASFYLDMQTVQCFSSVPLVKSISYKFLGTIMKANFYVLLNVKFWASVWQAWANRIMCLYSAVCTKLSTPFIVCFIFLSPVFVPVYFIWLCVQTVFCVAYYAFPVIYLVTVAFKGYVLYLWDICKPSADAVVDQETSPLLRGTMSSTELLSSLPTPQRSHKGVRVKCQYCIAVCACSLLILLLSFLTMFTSKLFIAFLTFLIKVITFTYIGIIANPKYGLMYVIITFVILFYVWYAVKEVSEYYRRLLMDVIHLVESHVTEWCKSVGVHDYSPLVLRLTNTHGTKGIPAGLYYYIVEHERPVRIVVFNAFLKLTVTSVIIYFAILYMIEFHEQEEMSPVIKALSAIFIGYVPHLLGVFQSTARLDIDEVLKEQRLEKLIKQYCLLGDEQYERLH